MRKNKPKKKRSLKHQTITFPCHPKYLVTIRRIVSKMWRDNNLPLKEMRMVTLAVDEAVSSITEHAKAVKQSGNINIHLDINDIRFKAVVQDNIPYFDLDKLSQIERNTLLLKEKHYQIALYLITTLMDEVSYTYKKGFENELHLIKFIKVSH
ncbi:MAG: ATP-binding protein [Planctomycetota bacterium]|nr:ATP-binding protein [Planctomycetota bacterium]MDI6786856.1 ATP-binding protein [Planctomycetota bacterium]